MPLPRNPAGSTIRRPLPSGTKKHIFLIDRHPLTREWLTHVLNQEADTLVCGEAAGAVTAMRGITTGNPHGVVMDLILDDGSGLNLIEQILFRCPQIAILVLSTHDETYYADRVLRAGAKGYISKREPTEKILTALRCVLRGKLYLSAETTQRLIANRAGVSTIQKDHSVEALSDREFEVFVMIGRGLGMRQIAQMLHLSPKTIQEYFARIKEKMQLRDATELLREAMHWTETAGNRPTKLARQGDGGDLGVMDLSLHPVGTSSSRPTLSRV